MPPSLPATNDTILLARATLEDWSVAPALADALMEAGYDDPVVMRELRDSERPNRWSRIIPIIESLVVAPAILINGNWEHVFAYAGEPNGCDGSAKVHAVPPGSMVPTTKFSRWDVAEVKATSEGENDVQNWLVYGRLHDGRWFFLTAGCDYTGWG